MTKEEKKTSKKAPENIYEALCKFQASLKTVEKTRKGYNFMYADLADIWNEIRQPLADNGFSLIQLVNTEEGQTYIITKLFHVSGECIESKTLVEITAKKYQDVGSGITYYRRYALSAMLGIVSDEDVDDAKSSPDMYEKKNSFLSDKQLFILETRINGDDKLRKDILNFAGAVSLNKIVQSKYIEILDILTKKELKAKKELS